MNTLKLLLIMMLASLPSISLSAPKKTLDKDKCIACVTQRQRNAVQKKLDDLRDKVKELEARNEALRQMKAEPRTVYAAPQRITVQTPSKKNRLSAIAGYGPSAVNNRRSKSLPANRVSVERGPIVGAQYQRLLGDTISVGVQVTTPTQPDHHIPTYAGTVGLEF